MTTKVIVYFVLVYFLPSHRPGWLQVDDELLTDYFKSLLHKPSGTSKVLVSTISRRP